jgi:hypothetical protein
MATKWSVPPAGTIESAMDSLKSADPKMLAAQVHELYAALSDDEIKLLVPARAYNLGLQVARTMLTGSVLLQMKGVDPGEVL